MIILYGGNVKRPSVQDCIGWGKSCYNMDLGKFISLEIWDDEDNIRSGFKGWNDPNIYPKIKT